ncbi:MAG: endonuclease NucS domain-containing protein [Candidatus Sulfotelmatobacter sp.]
METAIATCPDLFIEPGLALVRRQVVINGRRPDILFEDRLARRLLVEVQSGRLDEDHVQRHFYYFFDYRAKYPSNHLRLLFIANRIVPQHKEFLDEHGYEFREIPDSDFARRAGECRSRATPLDLGVEVVTTPGVLSPSTYDILYDIERERMTLSYKMLLLLFLAEGADASGRVSLRTMAERFQSFFVDRSVRGKAEENPNVVQPDVLSGRNLSGWERTIVDQPLRYISPALVVRVGEHISWAPRVWAVWSDQVRDELRRAALDRLVRYFDRNVPGGF